MHTQETNRNSSISAKPSSSSNNNHNSQSKLTEDQLRLFDEIPNSAVDLQVKNTVNNFRYFASVILNLYVTRIFLYNIVFAKVKSPRKSSRGGKIGAEAALL